MSRFTLAILAVFAMVYAVAASPFPILNGTLPITNGTLSPINGTLPGNSTNATAHPYIRRSLRSYPVTLPVPK
ncbi:hypothetical protein PG993_002401 [Apiospora rasikravindrae]|uniref:Uncharacterized protein n=1 Tax=Apiospora rasikravindrae TaxID=990691 RepID=A0ABR1TWI7_9PEZI